MKINDDQSYYNDLFIRATANLKKQIEWSTHILKQTSIGDDVPLRKEYIKKFNELAILIDGVVRKLQ